MGSLNFQLGLKARVKYPQSTRLGHATRGDHRKFAEAYKAYEAKLFNTIFEHFKFEIHNSKVLDPYNESWQFYGHSNLGHFPVKLCERLGRVLMRDAVL